MDISHFISRNMEQILTEWEGFAATFGAVTDKMSSDDLRDHAKQILEFVIKDIQTAETPDQQHSKSRGFSVKPTCDDSASSMHGRLRYASGFTLLQLIAEYRALRASVLKLWRDSCVDVSLDSIDDITRFNEAIDQSLAEAAVAYSDRLNETRETFIAILGHDLRSPLAATLTAGNYLSRPGAFDEHTALIGVRIKRSASSMNSMVNDLLGLARTQLGGGIPIQRTLCDLLEMGQWAIDDASASHPRAEFRLHARGELIGMFDEERLRQLLTNLANNAAQYGTPGKPIIVELAGEEDRVLISVRNEGPVIPEDALPKLFDSLVQLPEHQDHIRPRTSLGLGLFIAKQIAIAHGGEIGVSSDPVAGTVFTVEVPRH